MATNQVQEENAAQQRMMDAEENGGNFPPDEGDPFVNPREPRDEAEYHPPQAAPEAGTYRPGENATNESNNATTSEPEPGAYVPGTAAPAQDNAPRQEPARATAVAEPITPAEPGTYVPQQEAGRAEAPRQTSKEDAADAMRREADENAAAAEEEERRRQAQIEAERLEREAAEARRKAAEAAAPSAAPVVVSEKPKANQPKWLALTEEEHQELVQAHPTGFAALDKINLKTTLEAMNENLRGGSLTWRNLSRITVAPGGVEIFRQSGSGNPTTLTEVTGIVVWWDFQRGYWEEELDEDGNVIQQGRTPPACSSKDNILGIGTPGGSCRTCDLNKYGTARNGRGKACKEKRLLYVLQPGKLLPTILQAPSASIDAVTEYFLSLVDCEQPKKYWQVVTRFNLERIDPRDGQPYTVVRPQSLGHIPSKRLSEMESYVDNIRPHLESMYEAMIQDE